MAIDPNLINTESVGELPPLPISANSLIPHEVGGVLNHATIVQLADYLRPLLSAIPKQVIALDVDQNYVNDNFDGTGLGVNLMLGYAICNGNNDTKNLDGQTIIGYGTIRNILGQSIGSTTHTLIKNEMPVHDHETTFDASDANSSGSSYTWLQSGAGFVKRQTSTSGGGQPHNNMQPSRVLLMVMKL